MATAASTSEPWSNLFGSVIVVESIVASGPTSSQLLSWVAIGLLIFVSVGVIYLSAVDWRDRRRRQAANSPRRP
jgi:uncharacterized membrane protein